MPALVLAPLAPGDGLDAESWAQNEFGGAPLGDARLSARLVASARLLAQAPLRAITGAAKGVRALVKGHYRLIDQPADSAVTVENILRPHRERTLRRMGAHEMVLCIQDTTLMNFTRRGQTQGLAALGSNQTGAVARGLHLHTTLAVNPEGVPLGVLRAGFDAPQPADQEAPGEPQSSAPKTREERKSYRWIEGLCTTVRRRPRNCRIRACCAPWTVKPTSLTCSWSGASTRRRSNCWSVPRSTGCSPRSARRAGDQVTHRLFDEVRSGPARGTCRVEVKRQSARPKASKQARKKMRAARIADMTLRYQPVALPCLGAAPVQMWVVHAREQRPPAEVEPLEWFLLSTLPAANAADAQQILHWYTLRWRIEDYFRVLKSGCKVEELQHHTAERLQRAIAIKMVIGWRIQLMVRLGRELPDLPAELLFSDIELRVLTVFATSRQRPPPARLGGAVELVACLGGWLGRTRDPPGAQLMWHGYSQLVAMTFVFELRDEYE